MTTRWEKNRGSTSEFALRVLEFDVEKHGTRFVFVEFVEFVASTILCTLLALVVMVAAVVRGTGGALTFVAVIFFVGVAVNSVAVARWVRKPQSRRRTPGVSLLDVVAFAVATLLPGVLALALRCR